MLRRTIGSLLLHTFLSTHNIYSQLLQIPNQILTYHNITMETEPTKEDFVQAHARILPYIHQTLLLSNQSLNKITQSEVYFKCQNLQKVGAFKSRGAANKVLQLDNPSGVCTHSSGNHGQALAYVGKSLSIPVVVVMPENSPQVKKDAVRQYGAEIVECGNTQAEREETTKKVVEERGLVFVHPYNDWGIITGQGTAAYQMYGELDKRNIKLDYVVFPIGGGGLSSGTLLATKYFSPETVKIGVEPEMAQDAYLGWKKKELQPQLPPKSIADGLRTSLGDKTFKVISQNIDDIILVSELQIIQATKLFFERTKMIIEPSSATVLAAIIKDNRFKGKRVGTILSGGNIDLTAFFNGLEDKFGSLSYQSAP